MKNNNNKILTIAIIMLVCDFILIIGFIYPLKNKVSILKLQVITSEKNFFIEQNEITNLLAANQIYKKTDTNQLKNIYLKKGDELFLFRTLENLANNNQCEITINLSEPTDKNNYHELSLKLTITGQLENILNFITATEKENFYLNYQTVSLTGIGNSQSAVQNQEITSVTNNNVAAEITTKTFWQ